MNKYIYKYAEWYLKLLNYGNLDQATIARLGRFPFGGLWGSWVLWFLGLVGVWSLRRRVVKSFFWLLLGSSGLGASFTMEFLSESVLFFWLPNVIFEPNRELYWKSLEGPTWRASRSWEALNLGFCQEKSGTGPWWWGIPKLPPHNPEGKAKKNRGPCYKPDWKQKKVRAQYQFDLGSVLGPENISRPNHLSRPAKSQELLQDSNRKRLIIMSWNLKQVQFQTKQHSDAPVLEFRLARVWAGHVDKRISRVRVSLLLFAGCLQSWPSIAPNVKTIPCCLPVRHKSPWMYLDGVGMRRFSITPKGCPCTARQHTKHIVDPIVPSYAQDDIMTFKPGAHPSHAY